MSGKINTRLLGAAAEHFVMSRLLRQDMIAALAPVGVPDADIIVSDRIGSTLAAVQVKARRGVGSDGGWHMSRKHETIVRNSLFYCFVDFGTTLTDATHCWVVPSKIVADVVTRSHAAWLALPGRKGQAHNDSDMRRFLPHYKYDAMPEHGAGWLAPYFEAWALISAAG